MNGTVPNKRRALGRGLGALIPGGAEYEADRAERAASPSKRDYFLAPIEEIHPNPDQPRKSFEESELEALAQSIREQGIIQPLVVKERSGQDGGGFTLVAGERRWRAAQRAGLREIPVVIKNVSSAKAFEMALVENVQRADLNPIEEAEAYQRLSDEYGQTQEQIAERVGKDRATIANAMRLLKLPLPVRKLVQDGELSMGHARALLGLEDSQVIDSTARKVISRALSVRATEELVRRERDGAPGRPAPPQKSANVRDLEEKLTRALGAKVRVADRGGSKGGRLEIEYSDLDDLDRLLKYLLQAGD